MCAGGGWARGQYTDNAKAHSPLVYNQCDSASPCPPSLAGILQRRDSCWHRCGFSVEVDSTETSRHRAKGSNALFSSIHDGKETRRETGYLWSVISYPKNPIFFGGAQFKRKQDFHCGSFLHSALARVHLDDGWKSPVDLLFWITFVHHIRGKCLSLSPGLLFLLLCQSAALVTTRRYILFAPMFRCRCCFSSFFPLKRTDNDSIRAACIKTFVHAACLTRQKTKWPGDFHHAAHREHMNHKFFDYKVLLGNLTCRITATTSSCLHMSTVLSCSLLPLSPNM